MIAAYLTTAVVVALITFVIAATGWSRGLTIREHVKEVAATVGGAVLLGVIWPLALVALVMIFVIEHLS